MNIVIIILLIPVGIIALVLLIALFLKKVHYVNCETTINVSSQKVYDFLRFLKNQEKFNKWAKRDANRQVESHGTDGTVGYIYSWSGNKEAGCGEKEIINLIEGKKIETEIRFTKPMKVSSQIIMELEALGENQTKVNFINTGRLNYPLNFLILFAEKNFAKDMDSSLATLKEILEKGESL
jgi:hypothetical protein